MVKPFSRAGQTHLKLKVKIVNCLPAKFPVSLLDNAAILSKLRIAGFVKYVFSCADQASSQWSKDSIVAGFLLLVSSPVVVAGGGDRVIKSTYIRASDNSQKKKSNFTGFLGQNRGKIGRFGGNFQGKLGRKAIGKQTADFVVIFRANFARNRSVLR